MWKCAEIIWYRPLFNWYKHLYYWCSTELQSRWFYLPVWPWLLVNLVIGATPGYLQVKLSNQQIKSEGNHYLLFWIYQISYNKHPGENICIFVPFVICLRHTSDIRMFISYLHFSGVKISHKSCTFLQNTHLGICNWNF